jgi:hypothetical protein
MLSNAGMTDFWTVRLFIKVDPTTLFSKEFTKTTKILSRKARKARKEK